MSLEGLTPSVTNDVLQKKNTQDGCQKESHLSISGLRRGATTVRPENWRGTKASGVLAESRDTQRM